MLFSNLQRHRLRPRQMLREPIAGETRNSLKRARFFEKMRRTGNDLQFHLAAHLGKRILIHINDEIIRSPDDQQR